MSIANPQVKLVLQLPPDNHNSIYEQQCNTLKEELVARLVFELPRTQTWIADVRFKDQIIVSQEKRGVCHGTNI